MFSNKSRDSSVPLGDPGPLIEELSGLKKWTEVELDRDAAQRYKLPNGSPVHRWVVGVAVEIQQPLGGNTKAEGLFTTPGCGTGSDSRLARVWIVGIEARCRRKHQVRIARGLRENRDAIEGAASRHDSASAQDSACRLETDEIVEHRK